jgi:hypothetical protein
MGRIQKISILIALSVCSLLTVTYAGSEENSTTENSYYLYTGALKRNDAGVVAVPSRFQWSVETSWRGIDAQGNNLPDTRVMLRLYDPHQNFTALTAQLDLETAERLQRDLADIIAKKRQDPDFQHRPQLYDSSRIPVGRLKGIDENGQAIIELEPKQPK